MLIIDETDDHVMRISLSEFGSMILVWPKELTVKWLEHGRQMVCFQLDTMIAGAKRKTAHEEAADAEFASWYSSAITTVDGASQGERNTSA